jgi:DHA2 family methylenomycin A resistance protein-like MFS transporter
MLLPFALMPTGMGLGVPAMTTSVLAAVDKRVSGVAAGVLNAARQAGGAIGIAIFGALAGDSRERIVAGLHTSALIAVGLLLLAASLAFFAIKSKQPARAKATA